LLTFFIVKVIFGLKISTRSAFLKQQQNNIVFFCDSINLSNNISCKLFTYLLAARNHAINNGRILLRSSTYLVV